MLGRRRQVPGAGHERQGWLARPAPWVWGRFLGPRGYLPAVLASHRVLPLMGQRTLAGQKPALLSAYCVPGTGLKSIILGPIKSFTIRR